MPLIKQISTGSQKGNCYIYSSLMLDCGIKSYIHISEYIEEIEVIFVSHTHTDHARFNVMDKIGSIHKEILFIGSHALKDTFEELELNHKIIEENEVFEYKGYRFALIKLYHDVPNYGLRILHDDIKGIYITDTAHYEGIVAKNYDFFVVEANYDEVKHLKLAENSKNPARYTNAFNSHASIEQCDQFLDLNAKEGSEILKVHLSTSYDPLDYLTHYHYEKKENSE